MTVFSKISSAAYYAKNAALIVGVPCTAIAAFDLWNLDSDLKKWAADCQVNRNSMWGSLNYQIKESLEHNRRVDAVALSLLSTVGIHYTLSSIERGLKC